MSSCVVAVLLSSVAICSMSAGFPINPLPIITLSADGKRSLKLPVISNCKEIAVVAYGICAFFQLPFQNIPAAAYFYSSLSARAGGVSVPQTDNGYRYLTAGQILPVLPCQSLDLYRIISPFCPQAAHFHKSVQKIRPAFIGYG